MKIQRGSAVLAVGLTMLIAACTGSSNSPTGTTTTRSSGPRSTTTPPPPTPSNPAVAGRPTAAGAQSFFGYFWDVYNFSYAARDAALLTSLSDPTCVYCHSVIGDVERLKADKGLVVGGKVTPSVALAGSGDQGQAVRVQGVLDQEAGRELDANGRVTSAIDARADLRVDAAVRWTGNRWIMMAVHFQKQQP